jgi:hypothetical protein
MPCDVSCSRNQFTGAAGVPHPLASSEKSMRASLTRFLCLPLLAAACVHPGASAGLVAPDRPGYTDTPTVMPAGVAQVEAGYTDDRTENSRYQSVGEVLLRVGVADPIELRLFVNSYATRSATGTATTSGLEDTKVGTKLRLIAKPDSVHGWMPNLALLLATTLPTGADGFSAGKAQPEAKLAAAWTTSTPLSFYTNAGYGAIYDGAAWSDHGWGSLATWYAASPRLSLFVEGIRVQNTSGPASSSSYVDGGVTLLFGDKVQLDARVGHGVGSPVANERYMGVGIARRF